ncbi:MAG: cation:proton antiporter, partial [Candidatus Omnitrophica bacterium]|nr:cation:proton antiporter [Candidatus Omnitrophota bacterium]
MGGPVQDLNILIVTAAVLSFIAILCKQPVIIAYIIGGILVGPWGMGWINELEFITAVSLIGVTLLLFLAG